MLSQDQVNLLEAIRLKLGVCENVLVISECLES